MRVLQFLTIIILYSFNISTQGFDLVFGGEGRNEAYELFEIPNEDNYIVIDEGPAVDSLANTLNITKVDNTGNVVFTTTHPFGVNSFSSIDLLVLESNFKIALIDIEIIRILTFDFEGQLINQFEHPVNSFYLKGEPRFLADESLLIVMGNTSENNNQIIKLSVTGELIWQKTNEFPNGFGDNDLHVLADNTFLIASNDYSGTNYLSKFDDSGNLLWQNDSLPAYRSERFIAQFPEADNFLIYGDNDETAGFGTFLASVSEDGHLNWSVDFTSHLNFIDRLGIIDGESNTLYLTGKKYLGLGSVEVLLQLSSDGAILSEFQYNEFDNVNEGQLLRDQDNGFVIFAEAYSPMLSSDPYIIKIDPEGALQWSWHSGKEDYYLSRKGIITSDGGYMILGNGETFSADDNYQNYLTKITESPNSIISSLVNEVNYVTASPTPTTSVLFINTSDNLPSQSAKWSLYNAYGVLLRQLDIRSSDRFKMDRDNLPDGVYYWSLSDNKGRVLQSGKIMYQ